MVKSYLKRRFEMLTKKMADALNKQINLAIAEKDHATQIFMHWYVQSRLRS